ncbi:diaminopropionate ammonia-lyase [Alternaria panax]|uniref:Diaminopropionate ammonia-lyase n=1 Tax=Alternaria panax TaxID=48097 RepID=A0AAD4FM35_9PLEO|nr:diaminopropionate ammonia-lyase [Alternaria panax]
MFHNPSAASWSYTGPSSHPSVEPFHRTLPNYTVTPLTPLPSLAKHLGLGHVLLKDESNRLGLPAFKILGASWAIHRAIASKCTLPLTATLDEVGAAARKEGVELVACTEGNWGRAVARMAGYLGVKAVIFVPEFMDEATRGKIGREGAEVRVVEGDYDDSVAKAREEVEGKGGMLVMDVSWEGYTEIPEWVVEGYTTMLTETDKQLEDMSIGTVTHAIASVGVGSWAQAVITHYKSSSPYSSYSPSATVIAVEPDTAASLRASLDRGKITPIQTRHTICNGMNCGTTSMTAWEVLKKGVDVCVAVKDIDVHRDLLELHDLGVKNGPCGAATLTALKKVCGDAEMKEKLGLAEESVVVLFSTEGERAYDVPVGA